MNVDTAVILALISAVVTIITTFFTFSNNKAENKVEEKESIIKSERIVEDTYSRIIKTSELERNKLLRKVSELELLVSELETSSKSKQEILNKLKSLSESGDLANLIKIISKIKNDE